MTSVPYPPRPTKPRPKRRWWVIGALLLLAALVVFGVGLWQTLSQATETDGYVAGDGAPQRVEVPAGEKRTLYAERGDPVPQCSLVDDAGSPVTLSSGFARTEVTIGARVWIGTGEFTSDTSAVEITCVGAAPGQELRIGAPLGRGFVTGLLLTILGPLLLGGAGVAVLVTTAVLWFTRRPGPPPGWTPPPGPPSPPPPAW